MIPHIVATLGPASADPACIAALMQGAARLRLNASHLDAEGLRRWLQTVARLRDQHGLDTPVVIDLQGAKMRVGQLAARDRLPEQVELRLGAGPFENPAVVPVPHPRLFAALRPGEVLSLNDDRVQLRVTRVAPDRVAATVTRNGPLSARKGINRTAHPVGCQALTEADEAALAVGGAFDFVQFAFSFVHTGAEAALLRGRTAARLVAKIERPEALAHLEAIDRQFDEIWLCRGDLGAQAGLHRLGALQRQFTEAIPALRCPALLAGQVLEHMTRQPLPTRSEVAHLYDVARAGYAGVVLSDETAIGAHPARVVQIAAALLAGQPIGEA